MSETSKTGLNIKEDRTLDEMSRKGCFVALHIRKPSLRTQLSWDELGLGALSGDLMSAPSAKVPSSAYGTFTRLESRMRNVLYVRTSGSKGGFRFVPFARLELLYAEIEPLRDAYMEAVGPFLETWEEVVDDAIAQWQERADDLWESLERPPLSKDEFRERLVASLQRTWPEASQLQHKFGVDLDVLQFTPPEVLPQRLASEAVRGIQAEARARAREQLNGFFAEAQNELRARAVEIVRRMHRVLAEGETIRESSVNPLREFVAEFRELSTAGDDEFQAHLDNLVQLIDSRGGAAGMRASSETWREVAGALDEVASAGEALVEEATSRQGFSLQRKFVL